MKNIFQHAKNSGKPKILHPTRWTRIRSLNWNVIWYVRNLDKTREITVEGENNVTWHFQECFRMFNPEASEGNRFSKV